LQLFDKQLRIFDRKLWVLKITIFHKFPPPKNKDFQLQISYIWKQFLQVKIYPTGYNLVACNFSLVPCHDANDYFFYLLANKHRTVNPFKPTVN